MKIQRKISILILVTLIVTTCLAPIAYAVTADDVIYEQKSPEQVISSGVTYKNIKRFLTSGWLNINVVTVDLSDPYVKLDLLMSPEGTSTRSDVKSMAQSSGAVAALNGDFFGTFTSTENSNGGYPIGLAMKSGSYVSTPYYENVLKNKFVTFSTDELKQVLYSYVTHTTTLLGSNSSIKISEINKVSSNYNYPIVYNSNWGKYSVGSSEKFPNMVEMVVENGIVSQIRTSMPPVLIPENGYVVTVNQSGAKQITDNFQTGDYVQLDIKTKPDLSGQDFAISGGTMLVKDGKPAPITHNISGLHPRSAIGTSADGRYLYMAAVDGRQVISKGVKLEELANIMIEIGAHNAVNLDGGGSTTLVGRAAGSSIIKVLNSPSESQLRKVVNSLGIFSTAPKGTLHGLLIDTSDTNIFVNTTREFTVRGYDQYRNPVEVNPAEVSWKITGVKGSFKDNVLTPTEVGEGSITASVGGVSASLPVSVLSSPAEIWISPRILNTSVGKESRYVVKGKNKNGYHAVINPSDLIWTISKDIGLLEGNTFKASKEGSAVISCSIGEATAFGGITAAGEGKSVAQPCEEPSATFKGYPSEVTGHVSVSNEQRYSGSSSYKLTYDFTQTDKSRAAYIVFPDNSITMDENITDIGVWVYNPTPKSEWLKAMLTDANGSAHLVDLTRDMSWTGWKHIKIPVDAEIPKPCKLTRIYTVQIDSAVKSSGELYIDDITLYFKKTQELSSSDIPANITLPDTAEKDVSIQSGPDSFQFAVMGKVGQPKNLLDEILVRRMSSILQKEVELSLLVGEVNNDFYKPVKKPVVTTSAGKSSLIHKNATFITLDDSKWSIRQTDSSQWKWFSSELDKVKTPNLFIVLPKPVNVDTFSDPYEAKLFQDILTDYKKKTKRNVWVITGGDTNSVTMERGIRNISASGKPGKQADALTTLDQSKYLLVTVKGEEVTYQIKNLY